jgi:hypothetical protein
MLVALLALFVALGGPAQAKHLINGKMIRTGTIRSKQIKNRSLSTVDLSSTAVRSLMSTPAGSIGAAQLGASSVNGTAIADDSITAADLAAGSVGNSELGTSAVSRSKIGNNAVGQGEITNDAVTVNELAADAVGSSEVIDGGLTAKDVGAFAGTLEGIDFPSLAQGACNSKPSAVLTGLTAGQDLTDDAIVVTPPMGWNENFTLTARAMNATQIQVSACNVGILAATDPDGTAPTYRYVSFTP